VPPTGSKAEAPALAAAVRDQGRRDEASDLPLELGEPDVPSEPMAMSKGVALAVGIAHSVTVPVGVIRPRAERAESRPPSIQPTSRLHSGAYVPCGEPDPNS